MEVGILDVKHRQKNDSQSNNYTYNSRQLGGTADGSVVVQQTWDGAADNTGETNSSYSVVSVIQQQS